MTDLYIYATAPNPIVVGVGYRAQVYNMCVYPHAFFWQRNS